MAVAEPQAGQPAEPRARRDIRVRAVCRKCGRTVTHASRKGIYTRCPCGAYVPGPAMLDSLMEPPDPEKSRRLRRKKAPKPAPPAKPAAAPVRRRPASSSNPTTPAEPAGKTTAAPKPAPVPAAPPRRRSFLDRVMGYGEEG